MQRTGDWLAWFGANAQTLDEAPSARDGFVQMGLVLLTTASLAVVSMAFAINHGVDVNWAIAIGFGVIWGCVILNIDRFLVLSMGTTRSIGRLTAMALPRFAMAALLAVVISTPLVLRVFRGDIRAEDIYVSAGTIR